MCNFQSSLHITLQCLRYAAVTV